MYTTNRTTNRRKQIISSSNPAIIFVILAIIAILLLIMVSASYSGEQFKADNVGCQVRVGWEEVNLRENYSTSSNIIATLHRGSSVTLTGKSYSIFIGNGSSTDSWTEVKLKDGTTGWVVESSIEWN